MKLLPLVSASIFAGVLAGFSIAWNMKPAAGHFPLDPASPVQTRVERRPVSSRSPGRAAPSEFSQRWKEVENDDNLDEKRKALLAALDPSEFPALMAEMDDKAGLSGLDYVANEQLDELFKAWHAKAPEAALAWLRALPKAEDRVNLLGVIVEEAAETSLDDALAMLSQHGRGEDGRISVPDKVLEKAAELGADKLLDACKLGLGQGRDGTAVPELDRYPTGFDFKRVLDGLAAAGAEFGNDGNFTKVPGDLLSEWAKRDLHAAWAWTREGKIVPGNEASRLIAVVPLADAGTLLGSVFVDPFDPASNGGNPYLDAQRALFDKPSSEMLDAFLQTAPGDREAHLDGLFSIGWSGDVDYDEFRSLILERMSPEQRVEVLRRKTKGGVDRKVWSALTRSLRGLGHSEEEIQTLQPELRE